MTENENRMLELANRLEDISYQEWVKLQTMIDRIFDTEKRKVERQLRLPPVSQKELNRF